MLIITCEHATNAIPVEYEYLFTKHAAVLATHRGYDIGAQELAELLANQANFHLFGNTSRLLVELNRSLQHPNLFSEITKPLAKAAKQDILQHCYFPYRQQIEQRVQNASTNNQKVTHISVHSFTPELNGQQRLCDIGLLYDSTNKQEQKFCGQWQQCLTQLEPNLKVRRNYPYSGKADGFTTYLRKRYPNYLGIELEVNQKYPTVSIVEWQKIKKLLVESLTLIYR
jgi:predicted N-formylglutamate amidohydrolase